MEIKTNFEELSLVELENVNGGGVDWYHIGYDAGKVGNAIGRVASGIYSVAKIVGEVF